MVGAAAVTVVIIVIIVILSHKEDVGAEETSALNWLGIWETGGLRLDLPVLSNCVFLAKAVSFRGNTELDFKIRPTRNKYLTMYQTL